jgi:hypothetical protein
MRRHRDVAHAVQAVFGPGPDRLFPILVQREDRPRERRPFLELSIDDAVQILELRAEPQVAVAALDEYARRDGVRQLWSAMPRRPVPRDSDDAGIARVNKQLAGPVGEDRGHLRSIWQVAPDHQRSNLPVDQTVETCGILAPPDIATGFVTRLQPRVEPVVGTHAVLEIARTIVDEPRPVEFRDDATGPCDPQVAPAVFIDAQRLGTR